MRIQTLVISDKELNPRNIEDFLKENYSERYALIENWNELRGSFAVESLGEGKYIVIYEIPEEEFKKDAEIFGSAEQAMGAFLTTALEHGWEEVPSKYVVYHADFVEGGNKLIAGLKTEDGVSIYDQLKLEEMIKKMTQYPRVITYSSDVLTYIQDIYPDVQSKAYVIAREIAKQKGSAPELEELGRIYGIDTSTLEGKLELIDRLVQAPIKLPSGEEVKLKPFWYPLES